MEKDRSESELISGGARILLSAFPIPSFYWGRCRVISIRQQTKSSCQHMLSSREITPAGLGGESLWHAHTVTASADTSWDIGLVCIEYKKGKKTFFCFFTLSNVQSVSLVQVKQTLLPSENLTQPCSPLLCISQREEFIFRRAQNLESLQLL